MESARASRALLVTSDEATIKFLEKQDEDHRNGIIQRVLDTKNVLIARDKMDTVKHLLDERARKLAYNPE